jgi:predicted amino acid-binding ACT domain protein
MLRTLDFLVSRAESQDSILQYISEVKEKVEELGSMISIEHDEFEAYGN